MTKRLGIERPFHISRDFVIARLADKNVAVRRLLPASRSKLNCISNVKFVTIKYTFQRTMYILFGNRGFNRQTGQNKSLANNC